MVISKKQKIVVCALTLIAWTSFVATGSFALFRDQVTLTDNTVTTGTASLKISNSQNASSTIYEDSRVGFATELVPGQSSTKFFLVKNVSDATIGFDLSATVTLMGGSQGMVNGIQLEIMPVDENGIDLLGQHPVGGLLANMSSSVQPLGIVVQKGEVQRFRLTTSLVESIELQSDTASYNLVINGTQAG
jgi:hypothetical protein